MRLTIISHTPHYRTTFGDVVGWGPTVREINHLTCLFSEIIHLAPLHNGEAPNTGIQYLSNVKYVPLKPSGGKSFTDKTGVLMAAVYNATIIYRHYKRGGWFHLRAPANLMLYALPLLKVCGVQQGWIKFAGSWRDDNIPVTYKWQRRWLRKYFKFLKVTVNGKVIDDPPHILGFENPCLNISELDLANSAFRDKKYEKKLQLCFVGQLEVEKGIINLLKALLILDKEDSIQTLNIVGDGSLRGEVERMARSFKKINVKMHGYLQRQEINTIYAKSHINILPSESEGFPKVIAEGAAYGAIPVVTDMSSLSEYIHENNGRLLANNSSEEIIKVVRELFQLDPVELQNLASNAIEIASLFTYERYIQRITKDIMCLEPDEV